MKHDDFECIQEKCIMIIKSDIKDLESFDSDINKRLSSVEQISSGNHEEISDVKRMLARIFIMVMFTCLSVILTLATILYRKIG